MSEVKSQVVLLWCVWYYYSIAYCVQSYSLLLAMIKVF